MGMRQVFDRIAPSWSARRTKPVSFVTHFLKSRSGSLLVEGCGSGRHSGFASRHGFNVVGFDFSVGMIKLARVNDPAGFYLVADVRALPFKDSVFDHSLSVAVLHHLKPGEGVKALKELKRVTKGESLISVWSKEQPRFKDSPKEVMVPWDKEQRFYYLYETKEFRELVSKFFKNISEVPDEQNIVLVCKGL